MSHIANKSQKQITIAKQRIKDHEEAKEAEKYHVLPLDDRIFERMSAAAMGRPSIMEGRTSVTLSEGMKGLGVDIFRYVITQRSVTDSTPFRGFGNLLIGC